MYIDAWRSGKRVLVSERINGKRNIRTFPAIFDYYVPDPNGRFKSMFGDSLKRKEFATWFDQNSAAKEDKENGIRCFESDVKAEYKVLEKHYRNVPVPEFHLSVFDIETEINPELGYSHFNSPHARITAITTYNKWNEERWSLLLCPDGWTIKEVETVVSDLNVIVFETEEELLEAFLISIEDSDFLTSWNGDGYDLPMIIQRIRIVLGGESLETVSKQGWENFEPTESSKSFLKRLSLFDAMPKMKIVERFGSFEPEFSLFGRVHLDYLPLYKVFIPQQQTSYTLDYILREEIGEKKIEYTGSLDSLWKDDPRLFMEYNIQDVMGLSRMDDKKKFIALAVETTHMACVNLKESLGSVMKIEHAIMVELHQKGMRAPDKPQNHDGGKVAGAYVHLPEGGIIDWVISLDIVSLYPSIMRMLNIGPEYVLGQFDTTRTQNELKRLIREGISKSPTEAWHHFTGVWEYHDVIDGREDVELEFILEDGERIKQSAAQWKKTLQENNWCITANGTVFDNSSEGIISFCLSKWFDERQKCRFIGKEAGKKAAELLSIHGVKIP